jgi:prevent-host-death family protein
MTISTKEDPMPLSKPVNIAEAKARLPELVQRAARGEEIVIARNGEPQARLVSLAPPLPRVPGRGAGQWQIHGDFNEPLPPEVLATFEGREE